MLLCSNALFVVLVERRSTSPQNAAPVLGRTRLSAVTSTVINFAPHLGQFVTSAPATGRRTGVQDQGGHRVHAVLKRQALAAVRLVASVAWPLATAVAKRTQRLHGVWD